MRLTAALLAAAILAGCAADPAPPHDPLDPHAPAPSPDPSGSPGAPGSPSSGPATPGPGSGEPRAPNPPPRPTGEPWSGIIHPISGGSVKLSLSPEPGPDGRLQSVLLAPRPVWDGYRFAAETASIGWPAGTALAGGVHAELHAPVLQDIVVSLLADGQPVASASYAAPLGPTPLGAPIHFALPDATAEAIPAGAVLVLHVDIAATVDVTLHATEAHPTGLVLGVKPEPASRPALVAKGTVAVHEEGHLPTCLGSPDAGLMVPCEWVVGSNRWFSLETNGTVVGFNLTLTWEAASPLGETLFLGFGPVTSRGEVQSFTQEARRTQGPSSLTLSAEGLEWPPGPFAISVWWSGPAAGGPRQDFAITGEIHWA